MNENNPSAWIVETDDSRFDQDVIQRSHDTPVVVDFWADWCGPCRMLGPVLEKLANEFEGGFVLAKADTARAPEAATRFGVSSIPAVFAIFQGEPVDSFLGALPEEQIRPWLNGLIARASLASAVALESSDAQAAEARYRELLEAQPNDAEVAIGLIRVILEQDRVEEARELLERLAARGFLEPEAERLKAKLDFMGLQGEDLAAARAAAEADPSNLAQQLALARLLIAHQEFTDAFEICLELVAADRQGAGEAARELMIEAFRLLPDGSELVSDYRRRLSMALY